MQNKPSETKLCECGCGEPAPIATRTDRRSGRVKGQPMRFVHGHHGRGKSSWNKGRKHTPEHRAKIGAKSKGRKYTSETRAKMSEAKRGDRNPWWKGETAGRNALHKWLRTQHPKTGACSRCNKVGSADYAFLCHPEPWTRDIADYVELCRGCHQQMDRR